ncbi:YfjI family protein [Serratia fonticola]|uniref:YfjI family protein n=1 Tax=Serratia fonticola TaxID=47917 RepID=UPI00217B5ECC|nr:YfjI family protein [Serratia fonticola]CAI1931376.1 Uncharacterised protein [Serratia fonticola]
MFNDMMTYPFRPWGESLDESEKMSSSRKLAEETGYPVDLFPPVLRDVIVALVRDVDAPLDLIAGTVLSAVSLACQAFVEIQFPDGRVKPCSLYNLVLADSGERKSTIYSLVMAPFFNFEKNDKVDSEEKFAEYNSDLQVWNIQIKLATKEINEKIRTGENYASEKDSLKILNLIKPKPPRKMKLIYTDTTPEAMQRGLYDNIPWAGLMSDEASVFFEGRAKNNLGFLNELWDGGSVDVERRGNNSFSVEDCNFTMLLMVQNDIFIRYFKRYGNRATGSGFLSRFLISFIPPSQVRRLSSRNDVNSTELKYFHNRVNKVLSGLKSGINKKKNERKRLTLSPGAQIELNSFYRKVEQEISNHRQYNAIKASLMKLPENALRIAGLLQYFHDQTKKEISTDIFLCAMNLAGYYGNNTINLFWTTFATPEQDAEVVYAWLRGKLPAPKIFEGMFSDVNPEAKDSELDKEQENEPDMNCIKRADIQRYISKGYLRKDGSRLNAAIKRLEDESKIWVKREKNHNGRMTEYIYLQL